jgi:hypothetical protein
MVPRKTDNLAYRRILLFEGAWRAYDPPSVRPLGARVPETRLSRAASSIVILVLSLGLWVAIWEALDKAASLL